MSFIHTRALHSIHITSKTSLQLIPFCQIHHIFICIIEYMLLTTNLPYRNWFIFYTTHTSLTANTYICLLFMNSIPFYALHQQPITQHKTNSTHTQYMHGLTMYYTAISCFSWFHEFYSYFHRFRPFSHTTSYTTSKTCKGWWILTFLLQLPPWLKL